MIQSSACGTGVMLSPCEAKTTIGDWMHVRSTSVPSFRNASPRVSLLPMNRFSTIQRISSRFIRK